MADKLKKGALVHVVKEKIENSVEALASDRTLPSYIFESKGEILEMDDDEEYALVKFYVPTPNVWLRLEQLELAE
ncbi:NAD(P)H-quinone oxidoreductase subunit O [Myxosarcina sp. GI1]|uniref:NAD(P)H-quinone oxidoreductase subunit O n=1 Tax=Myxosarcina sp. GI1 TaxID=1541065 RepID=UPI00055F5EAD|nr:NAD(P)H-quinone oxidoreductase subunit O [Myxosarcina sp. GI1]